jgi:uncharacterized membrane protein
MFWAAQAVTLLWVARKLGNPWLEKASAVVMALALGKFALWDLDLFHYAFWSMRYRDFSLFLVDRSLTEGALLISLALAAWLSRGTSRKAHWAVFGALLFFVLNGEVGGFFHDNFRSATFAAVSVTWTLFAVGMIVLGFARNLAVLRKLALALFALTAIKVVAFDMANVSTPFRVISFVVLGLMLIGASFLYYKYRDRIAPAPPPDQKRPEDQAA